MIEVFTLRTEDYNAIKYLTNEQKGKLLDALFEYCQDGTITNDNEIICPFMFVKANIDRVNIKYQERCEKNRENIRKRWDKTNAETQKQPQADTIVKNVDTFHSVGYLHNITKHNITKQIDDKEKTKKEKLDFGIDFGDYKDAMLMWLDYKRTIKDTYKSAQGVRLCYNNLCQLSGNSPATAQAIVEQSISNNWKGLFSLKTNSNGNNQSSYQTAGERGRNAHAEHLANVLAKYGSDG